MLNNLNAKNTKLPTCKAVEIEKGALFFLFLAYRYY